MQAPTSCNCTPDLLVLVSTMLAFMLSVGGHVGGGLGHEMSIVKVVTILAWPQHYHS